MLKGQHELSGVFVSGESDESDNENDPTSDEAILRLFNSDTEGDDFSGFSAQEEAW